jgi:hypothetical protein|tara:strand:- start:223 stop:330 length:108 start_codon:yes stop_codon:yes gene_type:complete
MIIGIFTEDFEDEDSVDHQQRGGFISKIVTDNFND